MWEEVEEENEEKGSLDTALATAKEIGRHPLRIVHNVATRAVGLPGDLLSLVNDYAAKPLSEALTGQEGQSYSETPIGKAIPTTEQHRKNLEPLLGESVKPQNQIESFADEVIDDAQLLLTEPAAYLGKIPSFIKKGKGVVQLGKAFLKSLGANLAGESASEVTGDKNIGQAVKMGGLFVGSLLDQSKMSSEVGKVFNQAESLVPEGTTYSAKGLSKSLNSLKNSITKGRPLENLSPAESFVMKHIDQAENLIKNGKIDIQQAMAQKKSFNEGLRSLWKDIPDKVGQKTVKSKAKLINGYLDNVIKDYGKSNKPFLNAYTSANQAYSTLSKSNFLSSWVENNLSSTLLTHGLLHLFGGPIGATAGATALPYMAAKTLYRVTKSPLLRNLYGKAIGAATKENATAFNKAVKKMDDALQEEENSEKWEFVD